MTMKAPAGPPICTREPDWFNAPVHSFGPFDARLLIVDRLPAGLEIGQRYRVKSLLGMGGMGAVYLGFQTGAAGFRRPVAIKRAHAHLAEDPEFRRMIINEAWLASLVRHPNVVSVCDVDDVDGAIAELDRLQGQADAI